MPIRQNQTAVWHLSKTAPLRLALFTDTFTPEINGVARTLERLTHYLEQQNIPYMVFAPEAGTKVPAVPQVKRFTSLPFLLYRECRLAIPNPIHLAQTLQSFQPTLIHIATPFNIGLFGLQYGKKRGIPMVASYHTHFDQYLSYYNLDFLQKWLWNYMRWFHRPFKKVYVPSPSTKETLIKQSVHHQIEIWGRGVDADFYSPKKGSAQIRAEYGINRKYIILYVGRVAPEKDIQVVLDTFRQLPPSLKEQCQLVIAGDGPLYQPLSCAFASDPQITFTGFMEGEKLAALYASSDLFLFPSPTETFGNVVLEAMASGLPVVGAASGGVMHLVEHGKTGWLCRPKDVPSFIGAVVSLLSDDRMLQSFSLSARSFALSQSWDTIFMRLISSYADAVSDEASSTA